MNETSLQELINNDNDVFLKAASVLIKICGNILKDPSNPKFRSISLSSSTFCQSLLPAEGALSCLFDIGFEEGTNSLILPESAPLHKLRQFHDLMTAKVSPSSYKEESKPSSIRPQPSENLPSIPSTSQLPKSLRSSKIVTSQLAHLNANVSNNFLHKVIHYSDFVLQYEDKSLQEKALQLVPVLDLKNSAEYAIRSVQEAYKKKEIENEQIDLQELLLLALLRWFKNDFFSWVDKPPCHVCSSAVEKCGTRATNNSSTNRIEVYLCKKCGAKVEFPRYNDPAELLRTRRGRCGEWANCFTLICRAMGWEARLVVDETDHVWTEVYLSVPKRWVHCDPCEGVLDAPLMYEAGWGKKLTYVIAYSNEEAQDVTWRYSSHHKEVLRRRQLTKEEDLYNLILQIRDERLKTVSETRKNFVLKRAVQELADMLLERSASTNELRGRGSGSLEWRLARGETGSSALGHVWKIGLSDILNGEAVVGYSTARDFYLAGHDRKESIRGWLAGAFHVQNMQLKVEKDWKMTYLARSEGCDKSKITWRFELTDGLSLDTLAIVFKTAVYHSGKIIVIICSGDSCIQIPKGTDSLETDAFVGKQLIELTAELSNGDGECAWQHTQLFRQPADDNEGLPFVLTLRIKK